MGRVVDQIVMMNPTATAHGMDGSLVEPDWRPLEIAELRVLFAQYAEIEEPLKILTVSPRPFSAASVVATRAGNVFVKRHDQRVRDCEGLLEEHRFMQHLKANGASVPEVLKNAAGETAVEMGDGAYEVHAMPMGVDAYEEAVSWTPFRSVAHAFSAGQQLAKLHKASRGYTASARKVRPLVSNFSIFAQDDPAKAMDHYLSARDSLKDNSEVRRNCEHALNLLAPFHAELLPLLPQLEPLWAHNDLHASNLFWSDHSDTARATAVIDFGLADRTNAIYDIALAIERNIVEWLALKPENEDENEVPVHYEHMVALLYGYESVRPLNSTETAALAPMTAICHAEFALTEADYFLGVLHSPEKARLAHNGYLVGHARWFRGASGQKLLDHLRAWGNKRGNATGRQRT